MLDVIQRVLGWLLTLEIVGLFAGLLARAGLPPIAAPIIAILLLLLLIHMITSDPFAWQRWRWKWRRWRQR